MVQIGILRCHNVKTIDTGTVFGRQYPLPRLPQHVAPEAAPGMRSMSEVPAVIVG